MTPGVHLFIDSSKTTECFVKLTCDDQIVEKTVTVDRASAQQVLPLIEQMVQSSGYTLQNLVDISVYTGPGSFTGVRVGVAVAQALSLLLHIPVNGSDPQYLDLQYEKSKWDEI